MDENQAVLNNITHAIQERKGKSITLVDMLPWSIPFVSILSFAKVHPTHIFWPSPILSVNIYKRS
jgi:hypothetical protein